MCPYVGALLEAIFLINHGEAIPFPEGWGQRERKREGPRRDRKRERERERERDRANPHSMSPASATDALKNCETSLWRMRHVHVSGGEERRGGGGEGGGGERKKGDPTIKEPAGPTGKTDV